MTEGKEKVSLASADSERQLAIEVSLLYSNHGKYISGIICADRGIRQKRGHRGLWAPEEVLRY